MAKYNFDELVKKANQGQGLYTKSSEKTEEEAEKILQQMALPERRMVFFLKKRFMSSQPVWPLYLRCRRSSL